MSPRLNKNVGGTWPGVSLITRTLRGGPIRYSNFYRRVWKPTLNEAGLPDMGIHALRHTCAAMLIAQGAHPKAIQSHLGHQSITTTLDRYGQLFEDVHERLAERVDDAYAGIFSGTEDPRSAGPCADPSTATTPPGDRGSDWAAR